MSAESAATTGKQIIERIRNKRLEVEQVCKDKGTAVYATFTEQERKIMRVGMFPAEKMKIATDALLKELYDVYEKTGGYMELGEMTRNLCSGIMDAANAGPDKLVV